MLTGVSLYHWGIVPRGTLVCANINVVGMGRECYCTPNQRINNYLFRLDTGVVVQFCGESFGGSRGVRGLGS